MSLDALAIVTDGWRVSVQTAATIVPMTVETKQITVEER